MDDPKFTVEQAAAVENITNKPAVPVASDDISFKPAEGDVDDGKFASNDGTFVRSKLDDGTNVEPGNVMQSQARAPAHEIFELAVETDAPGFEQSIALMTPRGSPHYREPIVEVNDRTS